VAGIFRHDTHLLIPVLVGWMRGFDGTLLHDPCDSRLADVKAGSGQHVRDLHLAECRAEELDLLHGVPHDIRKPIDRCWRLNECIILNSAQPLADRVVGDQEVPTGFRLVPTAHGPQLQDSHTFHPGGLRSSVWRNPFHTTAVDPQFFAEHGDFGFKLVDARVFRVPVLDQGFA
jgi:hypothetical protein